MEVAALGLKVDGTEGVVEASKGLDQLTSSAKSAESASDGLAKEFSAVTSILSEIARAVSPLSSGIEKLNSLISDQTKQMAQSSAAAVDTTQSIIDLYEAERQAAVSAEVLADANKRAEDATNALAAADKSATEEAEAFGESLQDVLGRFKAIAPEQHKNRQETQVLSRAMKEGKVSADDFARSTDMLEKELKEASNAAGSAEKSTSRLAGVARSAGAALAGALGARALVNYADTWSDLTSIVRVNIGEQEDAADVMSRLSDIARMTYSSMQQTAQGFAQNAFTLNALGKSTQEQLDYTEALNNALVVSGAKGQQAQMVQDSLNRAMAQGTLRSQELQNVMNYGSRIAELLAENLGVNVTELRSLAAEGKITGEVIYSALTSNMIGLAEQAETMPATIGDAFQLMRNAILQSVGVFDKTNGLSESLAENLVEVADAVRNTDWGPYVDGLATAAKITAAYLIAINAVPAALGLSAAATKAYTSFTAAATAAESANIFNKLKNIAATQAQAAATAKAAAAELAFLRVTQASLVAQLQSATATKTKASLRAQLAANTAALTAAQNAYTASTIAASNATAAKARSVAILQTGMTNLLQVAASFYAGWQIGTYLRNEFEIVEKAGIALASGFHTLAIRAGSEFKILGEGIKFALTNPFDFARNAVADYLEWISSLGSEVLNFLGFDGLADKIQTDFSRVRGVAGSEHSKLVAQIRASTEKEILAVKDNYADMFASVGKSAEALKTVTAESKTAARAVAELSDAQKKVAEQLSAIERAAIVWHLSADEIKLYELALNGASLEQIEYAKSILDTVAAFEAQAKAQREAAESQKNINTEAVSIAASLRTEEEAILESYARRRQIILDNTVITGNAQSELLRRLEEERNESLLEINAGYWERWLSAAESSLTNFDEIAGNVIENFSRSFGEAFESMIFDSESLRDAVNNMAEGMARSIVSALGEMAAQWLIYQSVQRLSAKKSQAGAATAVGLNASAMSVMAGLNAYASAAAIPMTGWVAAPGAAASALAATAPMAATAASLASSAVAGFQQGGYTGNMAVNEVAGVVHGQEYVFDAAATRRIGVNNLEAIRSGAGSGVTVILNESRERAGQVERQEGPNHEEIINIWVADLMGDGKTATAIQRKFQGMRAAGR